MTAPQSHLSRVDPQDAESFAKLRELLREAERADGTPPVSDQAILAAKRGERTMFGVTDGSTTTAANLQFVGAGIIGEGEIDLVIHPDARGRGLGTAALAEMVSIQDRAAPEPAHDSLAPDDSPAENPAEHPAAVPELRAWAHGENPAATALLTHAGFTPIRSLYRLALDPAKLADAVAGARAMPDGFRLAAFDPLDRSQAEAWVRVNAAAFASHPEQGGVTLEDFESLEREAWFAADDLILTFDTAHGSEADLERLAGYAWVKTTRIDNERVADSRKTPVETELYVLGVDPIYAGRGLGAALLGATLRRMATHAPDRITLYVDGDNESARALYDRAGFVTDQLSTQWVLRGRAEHAID